MRSIRNFFVGFLSSFQRPSEPLRCSALHLPAGPFQAARPSLLLEGARFLLRPFPACNNFFAACSLAESVRRAPRNRQGPRCVAKGSERVNRRSCRVGERPGEGGGLRRQLSAAPTVRPSAGYLSLRLACEFLRRPLPAHGLAISASAHRAAGRLARPTGLVVGE